MTGEKIDAIARIFHQSRSRRAALLDLALLAGGASVQAKDKAGTPDSGNGSSSRRGVRPQGRRRCTKSKTRCGTKCVDLRSDERFCGSCTTPCPANFRCLDGECGEPCGDTRCSNTQTCMSDTYSEWCCLTALVEGRWCLRVLPICDSGAFGVSGWSAGKLRSPEGVAVARDGTIWVADTANDRIQHFRDTSIQGELAPTELIGQPITGFNGPAALAITSQDVLYVCDTESNQIVQIDGGQRTTWSTFSNGIGTLNNPLGIAVAQDSTVWIADSDNHRVVNISSTGAGIQQIGTPGSGNGELNFPEGVAVDGKGNIYVADTGNNRIQKFDSNGQFLRKWGTPAMNHVAGTRIQPGTFKYLTSILAGPWDRIYAADVDTGYVQVFNSEGEFLDMHTWTTNDGTQGTLTPMTIAMAQSGRLAVADTDHDRIVVFNADCDDGGIFWECGWGGITCSDPARICAGDGGFSWSCVVP